MHSLSASQATLTVSIQDRISEVLIVRETACARKHVYNHQNALIRTETQCIKHLNHPVLSPNYRFIMSNDRELDLDLDVFDGNDGGLSTYVVVRGFKPGCATK